ncbi:MAG: response regulator [Almyronema sp.]
MLQLLLLEDDPIDCELITTTLREGGISLNLTTVTQRQPFQAYLATTVPDLILADYVLPKFDGLAALALAQEMCPQVPFILVSGVLGEEQAIESMRLGATDYVLKQRLERLVPAVRRALRESQERQECQRVTKALHQTDDLLRAIVEASPVSIITLDRSQQVITWNPAAEKLYGWAAAAVVDQPLPLIPAAERPAFDRCFEQVLENQTILHQEFQHLKQNGSGVDVSISLAPLHDADDHLYGVVMTTVDITARKRLETQRLNLLRQESLARAAAESANRTKDEFLAVLSHELRTPLNAILGWIKLVQKGDLKPSVLQQALNTIERNAILQAQLIEDLLDLSRIIRGQVSLSMQPVDIPVLMQTMVNTLRPAAEAKSVQIDLSLADALEPLLADPQRLQQVCWNLLSNAIKFTPQHGQVSVRVAPINAHLQIQVADSGIGIAPEFLPHVFEYFRQADGSSTRAHGGLGLGLAITRRLVELHGGTIEVESPGVGQGATFTVYLPLRATAAVSESDQSLLANDDLILQGIKAIVVDDEADARELLTVILEQQGAEVESTPTVEEALNLLAGFQPDVIISDIGMPQADGYSFLETVRALPDHQLCQIPAIALTAYARDEDRQRALTVGYQIHLTKPCDPAEVVSAIQQLTHAQ